jgi:hypothetical protein
LFLGNLIGLIFQIMEIGIMLMLQKSLRLNVRESLRLALKI